jgi:recombination protein RecA
MHSGNHRHNEKISHIQVREHYFAQEDETPEGEEETPVSADAESKNE